MDDQVERLVQKTWKKYHELPKSKRLMIAVSGIPGSGENRHKRPCQTTPKQLQLTILTRQNHPGSQSRLRTQHPPRHPKPGPGNLHPNRHLPAHGRLPPDPRPALRHARPTHRARPARRGLHVRRPCFPCACQEAAGTDLSGDGHGVCAEFRS